MPSARTHPPRPGSAGPLVFDTRSLPRRPGSLRAENRVAAAPADLRTGMAGVAQGADLDLAVTLESVTEGVLVTATVTAPVTGDCARCLEPVAQTITVRCRELFCYPDVVRDRDTAASYGQGVGEDAEDGYALDGDLLDLEPVLRDALVPVLPLAPLCREDCPGLCAECGVLLAQAGPEHGHDGEPDPRWAGLARAIAQTEPAGLARPGEREESGRRGRP